MSITKTKALNIYIYNTKTFKAMNTNNQNNTQEISNEELVFMTQIEVDNAVVTAEPLPENKETIDSQTTLLLNLINANRNTVSVNENVSGQDAYYKQAI